MNYSFYIESWDMQTIKNLPGGWSAEAYKKLLDYLEVNDIAAIPEKELRNYVLLAINDLDGPEAAELLLKYLLKDTLNDGQIQHAAYELEDEKLWEEYPDIGLQKYFFLATELLYEAFNGSFPQPKALALTLAIKPSAPGSVQELSKMSADFLLRLLSTGFNERSLMRRLFEEQLKNAPFPDAEGIVWCKSIKPLTSDTFELQLVSSEYWFEDFAAPDSFSCKLSSGLKKIEA